MNRLLKRVLSAATIACLAFSSVQSATLEGEQGEVMVNRGGGYRFVSGSVELKPSDMIIANSGGSAQLSYDGGCTVLLEAGAVITVAEQPPCLTTQGAADASLRACGVGTERVAKNPLLVCDGRAGLSVRSG